MVGDCSVDATTRGSSISGDVEVDALCRNWASDKGKGKGEVELTEERIYIGGRDRAVLLVAIDDGTIRISVYICLIVPSDENSN